MRPPPEASPAPWPTRILRPWLTASAAGLFIGLGLLSINSGERLERLTGGGTRAATYDPAPRAESPDPFLAPATVGPVSTLADPTPDPTTPAMVAETP